MPTIAIGSQNPVKSQAILNAFEQLFPHESFGVESVNVASGVADQPMTDEETRQGAHNRLQAVRHARPTADYWAAIEGGIQQCGPVMNALAWLVVASHSVIGEAKTATFPLPPRMAAMVRDGIELGIACDQLFNQSNTKHSAGAIGLLSHGLIDRVDYYQHAAVMALLPLRNPELYA